MNMCSFKKGAIEAIDQKTKDQYEEKYAGLGPLIGPHFHRRPDNILPEIPHADRFPHIARQRAKGIKEPFTHGIARYAPWTVEATESSFSTVLKGSDEWNGVSLKELEGQDFTMWYKGEMKEDGLHLDLSITSDSDSLVGFHTYYALVDGKGMVTAKVQDEARFIEGYKTLPDDWPYDSETKELKWDVAARESDYGYHPFPDRLHGDMTLHTGGYQVNISYDCDNQENSWQLWHLEGATFVCVEPLSASNPRKPILSVSGLKVHLSISPGNVNA